MHSAGDGTLHIMDLCNCCPKASKLEAEEYQAVVSQNINFQFNFIYICGKVFFPNLLKDRPMRTSTPHPIPSPHTRFRHGMPKAPVSDNGAGWWNKKSRLAAACWNPVFSVVSLEKQRTTPQSWKILEKTLNTHDIQWTNATTCFSNV